MASEFDDIADGSVGTEASDAPEKEPDLQFTNKPSDTVSVYADSCMYMTSVGQTIRLQFAEAIPGALDSNDPGTKLRYVGNLIMPVAGFENMMEYLNGIMVRSLPSEAKDGE